MIQLDPSQAFDPTACTEREYLDDLFQQFLADLIRQPLYWKSPNTRVSFRRYDEIEGRYASFWHLVSGGSQTDTERSVELERCRRIGWIRPMIEAFNDDYPDEKTITWWKSPALKWHGRRYGLATPGFDYVLFIEERSTYALVVTAYFVEQPRRRQKFKDEHDQFWKQKQEPPA